MTNYAIAKKILDNHGKRFWTVVESNDDRTQALVFTGPFYRWVCIMILQDGEVVVSYDRVVKLTLEEAKTHLEFQSVVLEIAEAVNAALH